MADVHPQGKGGGVLSISFPFYLLSMIPLWPRKLPPRTSQLLRGMRLIPSVHAAAAAAATWMQDSPLLPQPHFSAASRAPSVVKMCSGGTAELFVERFGFSAVEAARIEPKLPAWIRAKRCIGHVDATSRALQQRLALSQAELRRVLLLLPTVLGLSYESNLEPSLSALQRRLLLSEAELKKVVLAVPSVLGMSYEANLGPSLAALQQRLTLSEAELKKIVLWLPAVLCLNYQANIAPSLAALQRRLALSDAELRTMVLRWPPVLSLNYQANIEPSLSSLALRLDLSEEDLKQVVLRLPSVLGYSYKLNLEPKLDFLQDELALSVDALREKVITRPAALGYSLERRYRPRLARCKEAGKPLRLVVDRADLTDVKFDALLARP